MDSSKEEEDFPSLESIPPQTKIDSLYQSHTEKGIRKLCCELLDLEDGVENLCVNMRTEISEEVVEMEHELMDLRKHISAQGILVQDLMIGVGREFDEWNKANSNIDEAHQDPEICEDKNQLPDECNNDFLEKIDVLLAEHKVEEAIEAIEAEERNSHDLKSSADNTSTENNYKSAFLKRRVMAEDQLVEIAKRPSVGVTELRNALSGLIKLGKGKGERNWELHGRDRVFTSASSDDENNQEGKAL